MQKQMMEDLVYLASYVYDSNSYVVKSIHL